MRNILAIANKELRSYFTSPIGYATLGVFSLLYGYFYIALLSFFLRESILRTSGATNASATNYSCPRSPHCCRMCSGSGSEAPGT